MDIFISSVISGNESRALLCYAKCRLYKHEIMSSLAYKPHTPRKRIHPIYLKNIESRPRTMFFLLSCMNFRLWHCNRKFMQAQNRAQIFCSITIKNLESNFLIQGHKLRHQTRPAIGLFFNLFCSYRFLSIDNSYYVIVPTIFRLSSRRYD